MKVTVYKRRSVVERAEIDVDEESIDGRPNEIIRMAVELAKREGFEDASTQVIYEAEVNGRTMQMRGR